MWWFIRCRGRLNIIMFLINPHFLVLVLVQIVIVLCCSCVIALILVFIAITIAIMIVVRKIIIIVVLSLFCDSFFFVVVISNEAWVLAVTLTFIGSFISILAAIMIVIATRKR
jgi:hypothetical protein